MQFFMSHSQFSLTHCLIGQNVKQIVVITQADNRELWRLQTLTFEPMEKGI